MGLGGQFSCVTKKDTAALHKAIQLPCYMFLVVTVR